MIKKKFPQLVLRSVSHKNMEFVREVTPVSLPGGESSSLTGTQCIDRTWRSLDASIPLQLKTKKNHDINDQLWLYTLSWLYRVNIVHKDGFENMGKILSKYGSA